MFHVEHSRISRSPADAEGSRLCPYYSTDGGKIQQKFVPTFRTETADTESAAGAIRVRVIDRKAGVWYHKGG